MLGYTRHCEIIQPSMGVDMETKSSIHDFHTFDVERHMADQEASPDVLNSAAQGRLRTIIERIERLEEDKAAVTSDLGEVYAEAKGEGYDVKILRKVVARRKKDRAKAQEEDAILDLYLSALGEV